MTKKITIFLGGFKKKKKNISLKSNIKTVYLYVMRPLLRTAQPP